MRKRLLSKIIGWILIILSGGAALYFSVWNLFIIPFRDILHMMKYGVVIKLLVWSIVKICPLSLVVLGLCLIVFWLGRFIGWNQYD